MKDSSPYELPNAHEKLSFKFILDELKERQFEKALDPTETTPETTALHTQGPGIVVDTAEPEAEPTKLIDPEVVSKLETTPAADDAAPIPIKELTLPLGKKYFRIGEVSDLIGVESYVLRYWENEFKTVRPIKSKSGHRVYSATDVRALHQIRHLLHVEKFSVKGAKKKLQELKKKPVEGTVSSVLANKQKETLRHLLAELKQLVHLAKGNPGTL